MVNLNFLSLQDAHLNPKQDLGRFTITKPLASWAKPVVYDVHLKTERTIRRDTNHDHAWNDRSIVSKSRIQSAC